jgi:dihydrodipicolinate synthase/N-acetylneuraminate lyase
MHWRDLPAPILARLRAGTVLPAHPLALTAERRLDLRRQRALTRYYLDAGAGGIAVGVHATQFAVREADLYEPVLRLGADTARDWASEAPILIAGLVGQTRQALAEADTAVGLGYHAGLLSLGALRGASEDELVAHCAAVAARVPLFGFYLQPAVGGIELGRTFWRRFAEIDNVVAIKVAPFDRYRTLDVLQGLADARAEDRISLYTGNDDHIVLDLVTPFAVARDNALVPLRLVGGLLGHWSVWTKAAVALHARCRSAAEADAVPADLLALDAQVTAMNAAVFDVANGFRGCIPGCHEVLRRQGLLAGTWCLDPDETLSPGQAELIANAARDHARLTDDTFVAANLERWLA